MPIPKFVYAKQTITHLFKSIQDGKGKTIVNYILMGTYMQVVEETGEFYFVKTAGADGYVNKAHCTDDMGLKIFFIDVGQGDAVLIEIGDKKILVDGGPNKNLFGYLTKWQYSYLIKAKQKVHIDYLFISHFDSDHYSGLLPIIESPNFTFGTIYHNGIMKFADKDAKNNPRPKDYDTALGKTYEENGKKYLTTSFSTIADLKKHLAKGGLQNEFKKIADALIKAKSEKRLKDISLVQKGSNSIKANYFGKEFEIQILAPVLTKITNKPAHQWFDDESHTINGHSIVLKINYGNNSILLGGDLNTLSEEHLINSYSQNPFEVDVAKSCHHGSSDFSLDFMKRINPFATVISSGDNETYAHPRADAIGCAGKYSKALKPLVFSTELARSINKAGQILFGMINLRSNGEQILMAQMKESRGSGSIWDSYIIQK